MTLAGLRRVLLRAGVAAPLVALAVTLAACAAYPNFNHATQYISELGGPRAPVPLLFNVGVMIAGLGAAGAGAGFALAVHALRGRRIAAALTGACFVLAAVGLVQSGVYPWPDPRHHAINLGLGIALAPLLLIWGLWRVEGTARLRWFLLGVEAVMLVLTVLTRHLVLPGLVNDANVGLWERVYAFVLVGWSAVAAFALERRLATMEHGANPAVDSAPPTRISLSGGKASA